MSQVGLESCIKKIDHYLFMRQVSGLDFSRVIDEPSVRLTDEP